MTPDFRFKAAIWKRLNVLLRTARNETLEKEMECEEKFVNWAMKRFRAKKKK